MGAGKRPASERRKGPIGTEAPLKLGEPASDFLDRFFGEVQVGGTRLAVESQVNG